MKLKSEKEQLMLVHALLMTEYLDRRPPAGLDPYAVQARGPDLVPTAAKALARYLMDRRGEVLALESGKAILEWVDAHLEDALAIAAAMQSISDQRADRG